MMRVNFLKTIILTCIALAIFAACVTAQLNEKRNGEEKEELPKSMREAMFRQKINEDKKDFEKNLKRATEIKTLAESFKTEFEKNQKISAENLRILKRIEDISDKLLDELGGSEEDPEENPFSTEKASFTSNLVVAAGTIDEEMKKSDRFSVSASAINAVNSMLWLIKSFKNEN